MRYSFSDNEAKNANATGNALADTTVSALSNNGTEKDRTNTFVGQYTTTIRSNVLFETRGQYSQERGRVTRTRRHLWSPTRSETTAPSASSARTFSATGVCRLPPTSPVSWAGTR